MALLKKKIFEGKYPDVDIRWISWSKQDGGWILYDDLVIARKQRKKAKQSKQKDIDNMMIKYSKSMSELVKV